MMRMISYLMTNMSTLQVKLMWVGESRAKSNKGELQQREHLNQVKKLGSAWPYYTYSLAVHLDEPSFHLKSWRAKNRF